MSDPATEIIDLETRFWQAMVDEDHESAISLLKEPAIMVNQHGALQFTRDDYRKMAKQGPLVVTSFDFSDVKVLFANDNTAVISYRVKQGVAPRDNKGQAQLQDMNDTSTWIRSGSAWTCILHTETPVTSEAPAS